jgi:glycerol-3-phosphate O-acyltransferase
VDILRRIGATRGARFAEDPATMSTDPAAPGPLSDAIAAFAKDQLVEVQRVGGETFYRVKEQSRSSVAFYRNNVVHHFQHEAAIALALLARTSLVATEDELVEDAAEVLDLLEVELPLPDDREKALRESAALLESLGAIGRQDGQLRALPETVGSLLFLRSLLWDLLESWRIVASSLDELDPKGAERKELVRKVFDHGRQLYQAGLVQSSESLSKPTFESCLSWLTRKGLLVEEDRRLTLSGSFVGRDARDAFGRGLASWLRE